MTVMIRIPECNKLWYENKINYNCIGVDKTFKSSLLNTFLSVGVYIPLSGSPIRYKLFT